MTYTSLFTIIGKIASYYDNLKYVQDNVDDIVSVELTNKVFNFTDDISNIGSNISAITRSLINSKTSAYGRLKTGLDSYITTEVADFISSTETSASGVLDDLITDMTSNVESILTAGKFYKFFNEVYEKELPTSASPTISDSLISYL